MLYGLYGASGFGREVMPLVQKMADARGEAAELVFVDDTPPAPALNGRRVLSYQEFLAHPAEARAINVAVADGGIRRRLAERCAADGIPFFPVTAPSCTVLDAVELGEGSILCAFVTLTSNIKIGKHFHANLYSYVGHDCIIGDYVTFAPAVKCNGNIVIEDGAYLGTGAILRQGRPGQPLVIGRGAVVGMGAVVTRDVEAGATVVGNPARLLTRE